MMMLKIILGIAVVILRRQRYALFLSTVPTYTEVFLCGL